MKCPQRCHGAWPKSWSAGETKWPALIDSIGDKMVPSHDLRLGLIQNPAEVVRVGMHVEFPVKASRSVRLRIGHHLGNNFLVPPVARDPEQTVLYPISHQSILHMLSSRSPQTHFVGQRKCEPKVFTASTNGFNDLRFCFGTVKVSVHPQTRSFPQIGPYDARNGRQR